MLAPINDGRGWSSELRRTDILVKELLDVEMVGGPVQCEQKLAAAAILDFAFLEPLVLMLVSSNSILFFR